MDDEPQPGVKISVLIVSYNCVEALRECLRRLEQSDDREAMEILVVDAGSTDDSGQVDSEFPAVTVLRLPRNFGLTKARNIGVRTAKGDFLLLLSPDTRVLPDTVSRLAGRLEAEPAAVAVSPLLTTPDGRPASRAGTLPAPAALYSAWCTGEPWNQPVSEAPLPAGNEPLEVEFPDPRAVLVRSQTVRGMNYFDERYGQFGSDLDLAAKARRAVKRILLLPDVRAETTAGEGLWQPAGAPARDDLLADYANAIATYAGKHFGFTASLLLRVKMVLRALATFQLGLLSRLLSGFKIDGAQAGL